VQSMAIPDDRFPRCSRGMTPAGGFRVIKTAARPADVPDLTGARADAGQVAPPAPLRSPRNAGGPAPMEHDHGPKPSTCGIADRLGQFPQSARAGSGDLASAEQLLPPCSEILPGSTIFDRAAAAQIPERRQARPAAAIRCFTSSGESVQASGGGPDAVEGEVFEILCWHERLLRRAR